MNKQKYAKIILCCAISAICVWYSLGQSQTVLGAQSKALSVGRGRENPFAEIPRTIRPVSPIALQSLQSGQELQELPVLFVQTIMLKVLDAESLRPIIESLSSKYGRVSVDSKSNSLIICDTKESLERIMKAIPKDGVFEIKEKLTTGIYRIVYADIKEVEETLKAFISKSGIVAVSPRTNNIIVTDFESRVKLIDDFIKEMDRVIQQVLVEVRIYDISSTEGFALDVGWNAGRNTDVATIERTNTHARTDTETSGTHTVETTETVTETVPPDPEDSTVTKTVTTDIPGPITSYEITDSDTIKKTATSRRRKPFIEGSFDQRNLGIGTLRFGLLNDAVDIDIALNVLHQQGYAKLLANPRILVIDNETAIFKITRQIPYTELTETSMGGRLTSTKFKDVGVELEVTPHITRDGMLTLHIKPRFGIQVGVTVPPTVDTREADTKALVRDGQTIVLGGLRQSTITRDTWKVPILGDMPLVGGLFQSETELVKETELLIFITPRILVLPTLSPREVTLFEKTEVPTPKELTSRLQPASEKLESPMLSLEKVRDAKKQLLLENIKALQ